MKRSVLSIDTKAVTPGFRDGVLVNTDDQRLQEIQNLNSDSSLLSKSDYAYDANGKITQWTQQSGASDPLQYALGYDGADQLTGAVQTDTTTSAVTNQFFYGYDAAGNRSGEQINIGVTQATSNNLNQVTGMSAGGAIRFQGTLGKPGMVTVNSTPAQMTSGTSFVANPVLGTGTNTVTVAATDGAGTTKTNNYQVLVASGTGSRTLTYGANGNQTDNGNGQTYSWDAENRLTAISYGSTAQTQFIYDGLGRRAQIVETSGTNTVTKNLLWFPGDSQPCEERDASDTVTKRFYGQGEQIAGASYYYTRDHLGSVREMTDGSGNIQVRYNYDPYGRLTKISGALDSSFAYAGYYNHVTSGLYLTMYRAYNPDIGRWISRDPIGGNNIYGYVNGDPINGVDPFGLDVAPLR